MRVTLDAFLTGPGTLGVFSNGAVPRLPSGNGHIQNSWFFSYTGGNLLQESPCRFSLMVHWPELGYVLTPEPLTC